MSTESEIEMNQHYSVGNSQEQEKIILAKKILKSAMPFVQKSINQRDPDAYPVMADLKKFIETA